MMQVDVRSADPLPGMEGVRILIVNIIGTQ